MSEENIENKTLEQRTQETEEKLRGKEQEIQEKEERLEELEDKMEKINSRLKSSEFKLIEREVISEPYIFGKKITGTTAGTAGNESTHTHYLNRAPSFVFITPKSNANIYISTDPDTENIYLKSDTASASFEAYALI